MPKTLQRLLMAVLASALGLALLVQAQTLPSVDCDPAALARQQATFAEILRFDFEKQPDLSTANLFRLGAIYQQMALACGYQPNEQEVNAQILQTLRLADIAQIVAARAVGTDVKAILARWEDEGIVGDSFSGQLLFNGLANGLDGSPLGCAGCHNDQTAPAIEGVWTRTTEEHLADPRLAGYDARRYLVESVVMPNAYIVEGYVGDLMPPYFGQRLDDQQLADLVAFLESQDQER
jgi:mono/diheme cytochrome c family protein